MTLLRRPETRFWPKRREIAALASGPAANKASNRVASDSGSNSDFISDSDSDSSSDFDSVGSVPARAAALPLAVRRYRCRRLRGVSGRVYSICPAAMSWRMTLLRCPETRFWPKRREIAALASGSVANKSSNRVASNSGCRSDFISDFDSVGDSGFPGDRWRARRQIRATNPSVRTNSGGARPASGSSVKRPASLRNSTASAPIRIRSWSPSLSRSPKRLIEVSSRTARLARRVASEKVPSPLFR